MSSQQGPKAATGQHSAHILLEFILREPKSTSANFLGNVGGVADCWDVRHWWRPARASLAIRDAGASI